MNQSRFRVRIRGVCRAGRGRLCGGERSEVEMGEVDEEERTGWFVLCVSFDSTFASFDTDPLQGWLCRG